MIRDFKNTLENNIIWISAIVILNFVFGFLLWLVNDEAFIYIFPTMILGSLIIFSFTFIIIYKKNVERKKAIYKFLNTYSKDVEDEILPLFNNGEKELIRHIGKILNDNENTIHNYKKGIYEHEEYIESWAHEMKTPLALITFVLDNRKNELSPIVYKRLEYATIQMQENIERMLYYSRLKASNSDYFFENLSLKSTCIDVLEEYQITLKEHGIHLIENIKEHNILSDRRGLQFIIRQLVSNSIKYRNIEIENSYLDISSYKDEKNIILSIKDNGIGIKSYDLPFIFEKGFTGDIGKQRKNSTGIGLYLAKEVATNLNIKLKVNDKYTNGFEILIIFPMISKSLP